MYKPITTLLAAAFIAVATLARQMPDAAPQPPTTERRAAELRDTLSTTERMSEADSLLIIDWRPPMLDMERIEYPTPYQRGDSTSPTIIRLTMPRDAIDRSTITIWRMIINNGSMGNWHMPYPAGYLDARTLSFPTP